MMTATRFLSASAIAVTLCTSFAFTAEPANPASAEMLGQRIAKIRKQAHAAELRLRRQTIDQSAPPKNDIVSISCENGSMFEKRADGCFVASGPNPEHEVITLTLEPAKAGRVVRIDFPLDESLPGKGPGRTRNGNFAISEIEVDGGHAIAAWASASEAPCHPWLMLDRIIGKYGNSWNADAHRHDPRTLLLTLLKPTPAGSPPRPLGGLWPRSQLCITSKRLTALKCKLQGSCKHYNYHMSFHRNDLRVEYYLASFVFVIDVTIWLAGTLYI